MFIAEATQILRSHGFRLVSDDPFNGRTFTKYCVMCADEWPCAPRTEAESTIRLADQLLAGYEATC